MGLRPALKEGDTRTSFDKKVGISIGLGLGSSSKGASGWGKRHLVVGLKKTENIKFMTTTTIA